MKKFIVPLIFVVIAIIGLKTYVFIEQDRCLDSGGAWFQDLCVRTDTPEKELRKLGLVQENKSDKADIYVTYPYQVLDYPKIFEHLKQRVAEAKKENGFDDIDEDFREGSHNWQLNIDMNNFAEAGGLAGILGYIFSFTGGAHPNHFFFSVNFNTEDQKEIEFPDFFSDPAEALKAVSEYSVNDIIRQKKERLNDDSPDKEWILQGAGPEEKNYGIFVIVPEEGKIKALKFVFPPYSVGPYYEGTYEVSVPSGIFYNQLEEQYKDRFTEKGSVDEQV